MAKNKDNTIGLRAEIDTVDLKTGINDIQKGVKQANKDFQSAVAGLDKWSQSSEGLNAKLAELDTKLAGNKKKAELYKKEIERVSQLEGDHSAQLADLNGKLQEAETAVARTEKEIKKYSKSLEDVSKKEKESQSTLSKLTKVISEQESELSDLQNQYKDSVIAYGKNSKEAKSLAKQIDSLSDELENNKKQTKFADKQLELLDKQFDETGDSAEDFQKGLDGIKNMGGTFAKGLAVIGGAVTGVATAFLATASETKEYRTNMGKLESGFETSGLKAEQAAETYKELFSVVADEGKATEATAMIGQMAKTQQDLNDWVNISTGIYATFGDSLPIESLAEAALETSKTGKLTGALADSLNWAGVNEEKFQEALDECSTEQERQKLITETLNGIYDEASDKYQQVNKDVIESNKAQVELSDTMAKFGEKAEPILTAVKDGFNEIMKKVLSLVEEVDFDAIAEKIKQGFAYFIDTIIPAIINGFQWVMDNKDYLIAGIVAIGTAMLAWNTVSIIQGVVGAIKGWTAATQGMTLAQKALNLVMKANPIGIVISLVAGLVAGIVLLWNKNEGFRTAVINIWNKVKESIANVIEAIKKKFNEFKAKFDEIKEKAKEVFDNILEWFKKLPGKIKEGLVKIKDAGKDLVKGLWSGIKDMTSWITGKLKEFTSDVLGGIKKFFGIKSPSREMAQIGNYMVEGFAEGIDEKTPELNSHLEEWSDDIKGNIEDNFADGADIGKTLIESTDKIAKETEKANKRIEKSFEETAKNVSGYMSETLEEARELADSEKLGSALIERDEIEKAYNKALANQKEKAQALENLKNSMSKGKSENVILAEINAIKAEENATVSAIEGVIEDIAKGRNRVNKLEENLQDMKNPIFWFNEKVKDLKKQTEDEIEDTRNKIIILEEQKIELEKKSNELTKEHTRLMQELANASSKSKADALEEAEQDLEFATIELEAKKRYLEELDDTIRILRQERTYEPISKKQATVDAINNRESGTSSVETPKARYADMTGQKNKYGYTFEDWLDISAAKTLTDFLELYERGIEKIVEFKDKLFNAMNELTSSMFDLFDAIWQRQSDTLDMELEKFKQTKDEEIQKLDELKEKGIMSEREVADAKKAIEDEILANEEKTRKKKNELAKKQFVAEKLNNVATVTMQGIKAVMECYAFDPIFGMGKILAGIQAGVTAANIATIMAQKFVPAFAKGGIVNSPTLGLIGEAGKEAIMPLENNTGWIKELAEKLNGFMQKDFSFMNSGLQLQGAVAGNVVPTVTNYYSQNIHSPTQLSRREIYRDTKNLLALKGR